MVHYIIHSDQRNTTHDKAVEKLVSELTEDNKEYGIINMNSLLGDIAELVNSNKDVILVTELYKMNNILKEAIAPIIKKVSKIKEVYIFISENEYSNKNNKLSSL